MRSSRLRQLAWPPDVRLLTPEAAAAEAVAVVVLVAVDVLVAPRPALRRPRVELVPQWSPLPLVSVVRVADVQQVPWPQVLVLRVVVARAVEHLAVLGAVLRLAGAVEAVALHRSLRAA
jgi:hypothetical protein